ncbi:hypothetical protein PENTCL1PPCAC_23732, partial [Pristionchus entomophagus]
DDIHLSDNFISFMLYYMHIASGVTMAFSTLVFYLMLTKTPRTSRPLMKHLMLTQFFITFNDIVFGVLLGGIPLFPAPAGFCEGLVCKMGIPGHVALVISYFALAYVAASFVFCFYSKHSTVLDLTRHPSTRSVRIAVVGTGEQARAYIERVANRDPLIDGKVVEV